MSQGLWIAIAVVAALLVITALVLGLLRYRRRRISFSTRPEPGAIDRSGGYTASSGITFSQTTTADRLDTTGLPAVGDDAAIPRDAPRRTISEVELPEPAPQPEAPTVPPPPDVQAQHAAAERVLRPGQPAAQPLQPALGGRDLLDLGRGRTKTIPRCC
ncbi:hypothetical protein A5738_17645 [Mycobacterium colombiense]|nr:hypothetical protein A5738_17645 [Mycobacterium colombiense]